MVNYCPRCNEEILPRLRTGELKRIIFDVEENKSFYVTYQLYFCMYCKIIYYREVEKLEFLDYDEELKLQKEKKKEEKNGLYKK